MIPEDFQTMAHDMIQQQSIVNACTTNATDDECLYRTVIDRAYYAAFLQARTWVDANGLYTPRGTGIDHKLVRRAVKNAKQLGNKRHSMSNKLYELKSLRTNASYEIIIWGCTKKHAQKALKFSNFLIQNLQ